MTTFTEEQIKYLETKIDFLAEGDVEQGFNVMGSVKGDVKGSVMGNVEGSVWVNVMGSVKGNVKGSVMGNVEGSVWGNVMGSVWGSVRGDVIQTASPSIANPLDDSSVKALVEAANGVVNEYYNQVHGPVIYNIKHLDAALSALEKNK